MPPQRTQENVAGDAARAVASRHTLMSRGVSTGFILCAGVAISLGLSGCGGSGASPSPSPSVEEQMEAKFVDAIFMGHMNPDVDSVCSAYGAAEFYRGVPACPMARDKCPNAETKYLMDTFGIGVDRVPLLPNVLPNEGAKAVLVDFNSPAQGPNGAFDTPTLPVVDGRWGSEVVGVIDHHILEIPGVIQTSEIENRTENINGLLLESKKVGSTCTLIAEKFQRAGRAPSKDTARMLLGGIMGDTLGLTSVTMTHSDVTAVEYLESFAMLDELENISNANDVWLGQAEAKSLAIINKPLAESAQDDLKRYSLGNDHGLIIGSMEVFGEAYSDMLLSKSQDYVAAAIEQVVADQRGEWAESKVLTFIWVVNVYDGRSTLVLRGNSSESCVAQAALTDPDRNACFESTPNFDTRNDLVAQIKTGSCVSRKSQVQPALQTVGERWAAGEVTCSPGFAGTSQMTVV